MAKFHSLRRKLLSDGNLAPGACLRRGRQDVHCVPIILDAHIMRTNIEIDDKLMKDALRATGAKTKREAIELGRPPLD